VCESSDISSSRGGRHSSRNIKQAQHRQVNVSKAHDLTGPLGKTASVEIPTLNGKFASAQSRQLEPTDSHPATGSRDPDDSDTSRCLARVLTLQVYDSLRRPVVDLSLAARSCEPHIHPSAFCVVSQFTVSKAHGSTRTSTWLLHLSCRSWVGSRLFVSWAFHYELRHARKDRWAYRPEQ
jgi:hypothetical protein